MSPFKQFHFVYMGGRRGGVLCPFTVGESDIYMGWVAREGFPIHLHGRKPIGQELGETDRDILHITSFWSVIRFDFFQPTQTKY